MRLRAIGCTRSFPRGSGEAFTLIELMISGALMSIILASAYVCLSAAVSSQRVVETRSDAIQTARVAIAMIAADFRSAVPLSRENEFVGMRRQVENDDADNVDFATRNYIPRNDYEPDWCEVSYFVQREAAAKSFTLYRRRDPTPDPEPFAGGTREEIARGVLGFRLEYYDGYDWYDEWGDPTGKKRLSSFPDPNVSGLPEAVRITLTVDPSYLSSRQHEDDNQSGEPPLTLQTTARCAMSLFFYRTSGGSSTNSTSATAASPEPGAAR